MSEPKSKNYYKQRVAQLEEQLGWTEWRLKSMREHYERLLKEEREKPWWKRLFK